MATSHYIEKIRNADITAEQALADLQDDFGSARETLTSIKAVFEAVGVTSAVVEIEEALAHLDAADSYRGDPFLI